MPTTLATFAVSLMLAAPGTPPGTAAVPDTLDARDGAVSRVQDSLPTSGASADAPSPAGEDEPEILPEVELSVSGLISATAFAQDQSFGFGNGQSALFAASRRETVDRWFMGGDVRSTRLRLTADTRPPSSGWAARGILEIDFFGAFNGTGAFNDEQPQPRLRLAYVELVHGGTSIRVGQSWTPLLGLVPTSTTHVAFPLGMGSAGLLGWRYPGLLVSQELVAGRESFSLRAQVGAFRGSWSAASPGEPGDVVDHRSPGEAGVPQVEVRLDASGRAGAWRWQGYLVGHLDRKDLSGVGERFDADDQLLGEGLEVGGRVDRGRWTVQGNGHVGRAMGQQFGALTQFGDIGSQGGWVQVGHALGRGFSAWLFQGFEDPVDGDVIASGNARLHNRSRAVSLQWDAGPYRVGLEWLSARTSWARPDGPGAHTARQISFSVLYAF